MSVSKSYDMYQWMADQIKIDEVYFPATRDRRHGIYTSLRRDDERNSSDYLYN